MCKFTSCFVFNFSGLLFQQSSFGTQKRLYKGLMHLVSSAVMLTVLHNTGCRTCLLNICMSTRCKEEQCAINIKCHLAFTYYILLSCVGYALSGKVPAVALAPIGSWATSSSSFVWVHNEKGLAGVGSIQKEGFPISNCCFITAVWYTLFQICVYILGKHSALLCLL